MILEIGPKEQEWSVGKREGKKEGVPASVPGGQGFHHGRLPARTPGCGQQSGQADTPADPGRAGGINFTAVLTVRCSIVSEHH